MTFLSWLLGTPEPSTVEQWRAVWAAPVIRTGPADKRQDYTISIRHHVYEGERIIERSDRRRA